MFSHILSILQSQLDEYGIFVFVCRHAMLLFFLYMISTSFYTFYFHPLSSFPGPALHAISRLAITYCRMNGTIVKHLRDLHFKYGTVVRIGPSELSYIDPTAWNDIYGTKNASIGGQVPKDPAFYVLDPTETELSLVADIDDQSHARQRKIFSHAFSERALREQEGLIGGHVDKLVEKLREKAEFKDGRGEVDMCRMLNFTTFDIMSDLAFGEPLNLLETGNFHPWVAAIFDNLRAMSIMHAILQFGHIKFLINFLLGSFLKAQQEKHFGFAREKVNTRLARKTSRPDLWSLVVRAEEAGDEGARLTEKEQHDNAGLFMIAGTETAATLLSGLLYLLLQYPDQMAKLKAEIRALNESQLNLLELPKLWYLNACIEEGLRVYPPVPTGLPRQTPKGGATICGRFVPGNVTVSVPSAVLSRSIELFYAPGTFVPERWIHAASKPDPKSELVSVYRNDNLKAINPFSIGPRNCLGQNLAYHEMRLILAKLIWNFDLELVDEKMDWMDQRVFLMWEKKPLTVRVRAVER